ncbi:hypothetical protein J1N35_038496 [Gossypium stocksii]|uniref:Uncharacterized protein n=1 Tax=Gossypium stocksii TaxID=47602 RepID=A0A9D3ULY8_9ROSI|nr:hypothetical protein J1N35_038496 [Gossypium stocksii]
MAAPLQATTTFMQPTKVGVPSRTNVQRRSFPGVSKGFGLEHVVNGARLTCSLQIDHLKDLAQKCVDTTKIAGFALATFALVEASAEGVPKMLSYDEIQSKTYMKCQTIDGGVDSFAFKPGKYYAKKFCLEPTSFIVKAEGVSKNAPPEFQNIKLMTRLTYTLDEIDGPFKVSPDGTIKSRRKMESIMLLLQSSSLAVNVCYSFSPSSNWLHQANPRALVETSSYCPTMVHLSWTRKEKVVRLVTTMQWPCLMVEKLSSPNSRIGLLAKLLNTYTSLYSYPCRKLVQYLNTTLMSEVFVLHS